MVVMFLPSQEASLASEVKFFAWLEIQDRIWTLDRLAKQETTNYVLLPRCKRENESGVHHFYMCRFTLRLWGMVKDWLQLQDINTFLVVS